MITYIIYSESADRFYIGQCEDLDIRLQQHNAGKTKSIKYGIPWKIVYTEVCKNRSEAIQLERKIKNRGAKRFLENRKKDPF